MPIREAIARLIAAPPEPDPRLGELQVQVNELQAKVAKLDKRLSMTMGALQAATAQLTGLDSRTSEALSTARQANQIATTARSTAESVAEGLEALEGEADAPADLSVLDGTVANIREALATLTPGQSQVISLKFLDGLSIKEVASIMDKTPGAVKSLQHRGLANLQRTLKQIGYLEAAASLDGRRPDKARKAKLSKPRFAIR